MKEKEGEEKNSFMDSDGKGILFFCIQLFFKKMNLTIIGLDHKEK